MNEERQSSNGVELFLDNRQVFLLFFASAVVLSLVFAVGVVVGKRVSRPVATEPTTDPLAMLDQMGNSSAVDDNLTFHDALTGKKAPPAAAAPATASDEAGTTTPAPSPAASKPAPKPEPVVAPKAAPKAAPKPVKLAQHKPAQKASAKAGADKQEAKGEAGAEAVASSFTLQLSAFQDRHEAEIFMQKLRDTGMKPYLVATTIPGRGVWYRVRLGSFDSWDKAVQAKQQFEQRQKIIAYVAKK